MPWEAKAPDFSPCQGCLGRFSRQLASQYPPVIFTFTTHIPLPPPAPPASPATSYAVNMLFRLSQAVDVLFLFSKTLHVCVCVHLLLLQCVIAIKWCRERASRACTYPHQCMLTSPNKAWVHEADRSDTLSFSFGAASGRVSVWIL